jgi:hypothetical protein
MDEMTKLDPPEESRVYTWPDGGVVRVENVTHFLARPSGTHRLRAGGKLYIIAPGWRSIEISASDWTL